MMFSKNRSKRTQLRATPIEYCGNRFVEVRIWLNGERDKKRGLLVCEEELRFLGLALLSFADRGLASVDAEPVEPRNRRAKENLRAEILGALLQAPAESSEELRRRLKRKRSRVQAAVRDLIGAGAVRRVGRRLLAVMSAPVACVA